MKDAQEIFGDFLKQARENFRDGEHLTKGLSLRELGRRAGMNFGRIGDIEKGRRCANEENLKKLAAALNLEGPSASDFVLRGLRATGKQKLPHEFTGFPPYLFEVLMREVQLMNKGAVPGRFMASQQHPECDLLWQAENGQWFAMEILAAAGASPQEAVRKLREKVNRKAGEEPERPR
jgi:transcriptional regulator with XRE-family HTH domain